MMTLKDVINFYFSKNDTIKIKIEMIEGIKGKYRIVTKEELKDILEGWGDYEVVDFGWQIYYSSLNHLGEKIDLPIAWVTIKE